MKGRYAALGGFVVIAIIAGVVLATSLGNGRLFGAGSTRLVVWFDKNVKGLSMGAPVTFRGVQIGQVESIDLKLDTATLQSHMPVTLRISPALLSIKEGSDAEIRRALADLINRGLVARMVMQSFVTGQVMIDLDIGQAPRAPVAQLADAPLRVPTQGGTFDDFVDQVAALPLKDAVTEMRQTLTSIRALADTSKVAVTQVQTSFDTLSKQATATTKGLGEDVRLTTQEAQQTLVAVRRFADQGTTLVNKVQPDLEQSIRSLSSASTSAEQSMTQLSAWVGPGSATRENLDGAVRDFSRAVRSLNAFAEVIEEQPNALLFGRSNAQP